MGTVKECVCQNEQTEALAGLLSMYVCCARRRINPPQHMRPVHSCSQYSPAHTPPSCSPLLTPCLRPEHLSPPPVCPALQSAASL